MWGQCVGPIQSARPNEFDTSDLKHSGILYQIPKYLMFCHATHSRSGKIRQMIIGIWDEIPSCVFQHLGDPSTRWPAHTTFTGPGMASGGALPCVGLPNCTPGSLGDRRYSPRLGSSFLVLCSHVLACSKGAPFQSRLPAHPLNNIHAACVN